MSEDLNKLTPEARVAKWLSEYRKLRGQHDQTVIHALHTGHETREAELRQGDLETLLARLQAAEERAETLAAVAERAREELRLIRAKDSDAVYDTTLRLDMALALKTGA